MAAAAFVSDLAFRANDGEALLYHCTVSDVNAEFWVFPDGSGEVVLPSGKLWTLEDIQIVTGGTDTSTASLFANGNSTSIVVSNKGNLTTNLARQFIGRGLAFNGGTKLKFKQAT